MVGHLSSPLSVPSMVPEDGWMIFSPGGVGTDGRTIGSQDNVFLIRESAPMFWGVESGQTTFNLRNLIKTWFPKHRAHFEALFESLDPTIRGEIRVSQIMVDDTSAHMDLVGTEWTSLRAWRLARRYEEFRIPQPDCLVHTLGEPPLVKLPWL